MQLTSTLGNKSRLAKAEKASALAKRSRDRVIMSAARGDITFNDALSVLGGKKSLAEVSKKKKK